VRFGVLVAFVLAACSRPPPPPPPPWTVGTAYASPETPTVRGFLDRRGLIHAHSVYSHDACDNRPVDDAGVYDQACFEDFRRDLCAVGHDFVMLTDHRDSFATIEYPEALLYRPERGDALVERGGRPIANFAACPDGSKALILAGTESGMMPVGLEQHVVEREARDEFYGRKTPETVTKFKENGAVVLLQHTEDWTPEQIAELGVDGFEMFNIHANLVYSAADVLGLVARVLSHDEGLPHPDLAVLSLFQEDHRYLSTWAKVLARGRRAVTTMGSDCHRNSFPPIASDGERIDSYRRVMSLFSNHLLVRPDADGGFDDLALKEALGAGRLYGVFEAMGVAEGFDFRAESAAGTAELGGEVALAAAPVLHVQRPRVKRLDPARTAPTMVLRLVKATEEGWVEVASAATGDLAFTPTTAGAYRAEVRIKPLHLREDLHDDAEAVLAKDLVWIYANAIYVR
jgi:hypothetical protein